MPIRVQPHRALKTWPQINSSDFTNLRKAYLSQSWWRGAGRFCLRTENEIRKYLKIPHALLVNSGTTALEIAIRALNLPEGSEIIVPALTFFTTASAVIKNGCVPIFVDINPDTYCVDPSSLQSAVTKNSKAIIPVHFAGFPCDMKPIISLAKKHRMSVIEDAAHAFGTLHNGQHAGTLGQAGCFSFQQYKNLTCGEGGSIVTSSKKLFEEMYSLSDCGRKHDQPLHIHFACGGNYRLSEIQASLLISQIKRINILIAQKEKAATMIDEALSHLKYLQPLYLNSYPFSHRHSRNFYVFKLVTPKPVSPFGKQRIIDRLNKMGIPCYHYPKPVFDNPFFKKYRRWRKVPCPNAIRACYSEGIFIDQSFLLTKNLKVTSLTNTFSKIEKLI